MHAAENLAQGRDQYKERQRGHGRIDGERSLQIPVHRGQSFRRIADSIPVIADSFS
jgi:hypothetical protein